MKVYGFHENDEREFTYLGELEGSARKVAYALEDYPFITARLCRVLGSEYDDFDGLSLEEGDTAYEVRPCREVVVWHGDEIHDR